MVSLGDYIQHMREIAQQSYQSYIASESGKPSQSSESDCDGNQHAKCDTWCASSKCVHGCNRECNCDGISTCIDDERLPNSIDENRNKDRNDFFYNSLDTQGIPIPVFGEKGQLKYRWTKPSAIVGAVCEVWDTAAECVPRCFYKPVGTGSNKTPS